ncbi:trimethylamine-N-oxide reductase TorA [Afifella marina]|uniref:Dimethyl sulfoxide/trimethylamine N-oxide reductase n=1 Tax=Afifella marina DSM 2698 TaxID=1120955 RepID=A0A1G5P7V0_AFIMA|nr:trimethylamine-N-oxide reductase TorA [Afifella marina]MBK1624828.1 trimethylamine-N-oxide reductase TorA [Afifella marina DSM 2698]MBK1628422.1 trimethylamine-N-oxide reductase TorA [Afifella marina]MBK5917909.1 trimethylamine-N-oxide reductase TorA [Afifella marina]RAI18750.1 trimethylamine-N-oxide reductase TorA [Afifella marina DSM 2698]SCZ45161.1 trimethylamine-N-oxide reductase (cytochrome c) [Afifella marina DSM 2698]
MSTTSTPQRPAVSRRHFLQGAAALGALGMAGSSLLTKGALAQSASKDTISACHWGVFRGHKEDGRLTALTPWEKDPFPSPQLPGVLDSIYSPTRIKYPMVRRAFLEQGPGADPEGRGTGDFVRVSWEKAIELVANELVRVRDTYGPTGIFGGSYGWKSPGKMHNCQTLLRRLLKLNGGFTNSSGDYSTGAAQVILPYVVGSIEVYEQCTTWPVLAENTELMVFWGANPLRNSEICWQVADHGSFVGVDLLKKAGTKAICIDPVRTETAQRLDAEWIAPRPQTDVAMMLGIAHTLYSEGLHDQGFLDKYTTGFDKFLPYLTGEVDGQPKSAEWASAICEIPADTIKDLARRFASHRTMLALGYSTQRQHHGEQVHWMLITLTSMLGQIGLPGGGYGLSYHYASGGAPTHNSPILTAMSDQPGGGTVAVGEPAWLAGGGTASIPVSRLVETLLNPGKKMDFNGHEIELPTIKLAYWVGGNPFSHHQDRNEMVRAWRNLETFIVHDFQWTATARHADIVLPATTSYERNDISQVGDYALSHIVPMKKLIDPVFESRTDYDIFTAIAHKLGKGYEYTEGKTEMDWIRGFYEAAMIEARAKGMEMPVFDAFWDSDEALEFPLLDEQKNFVRYADFRADPLLNALGTASGKIEIFSRNIEKMHYDDCPPHPSWMEPVERLDGPTTRYPLHIAANHPVKRLHSQLCGTSLREDYAVKGREPCWIHPEDAAARGLVDGDIVRVFNDRGQILAGLVVTDVIRKGVVRINEGGWFDPVDPRTPGSLCRYGDVNNLTVGIGTSKLAQGNCGQTAVAEVEKFEGPVPEIMVFSEPAAQKDASKT